MYKKMSEYWVKLSNFTFYKYEYGSENFEIKKSKNIFVTLDPKGKKTHYAVFPEKNISLMTFYPTAELPPS